MKRKRSFKRQRSQAGRGKPEALLQGNYCITTLLLDVVSNKCSSAKENRQERTIKSQPFILATDEFPIFPSKNTFLVQTEK